MSNRHRTGHLKHYSMSEADIRQFLRFLSGTRKVYAPHRKGRQSFVFREVEDADAVVLDYPRTMQGLKKYFLPPREILLQFDTARQEYHSEEPVVEERIFFAVHSYDLEAVKRLDYSFLQGREESQYLKRREESVFIGISYSPDSYHFGNSVGIPVDMTEGFSLFIQKAEEDHYLLFIIDYKGLKLVSDFHSGKLADISSIELDEADWPTRLQVHYNRLPEIFEKSYHSGIWEDVAERCLGCGTCNLLCPTCYCFEVQDEVELDLQTGQRERSWDGCMLNHFAEVAGGENFRESLEQRTRHRLNRKFLYITQHLNKPFCVGCGRCSSSCPAGIRITDIINGLVSDHHEKLLEKKSRSLMIKV